MLVCENNNIIKCPVPKLGRLNCLKRQQNGRKRWSHQQKKKSPRAYSARSPALLFVYLIGHRPLQHVVCCQQSSTSLSKGVPIMELRGWSVLHSYLFGHFCFCFFAFVCRKICLFHGNSKKNVHATF